MVPMTLVTSSCANILDLSSFARYLRANERSFGALSGSERYGQMAI
jgi:hypothetical protein